MKDVDETFDTYKEALLGLVSDLEIESEKYGPYVCVVLAYAIHDYNQSFPEKQIPKDFTAEYLFEYFDVTSKNELKETLLSSIYRAEVELSSKLNLLSYNYLEYN